MRAAAFPPRRGVAPRGRPAAVAAVPFARAVRVRDFVPHPVPGLHHRPGALAGVPRMALAAHARVAVARPLLFLAEDRSEEHTSEIQSLMRISYAVFCLKKKTTKTT